MKKQAGILLSVSSLPSYYGIGDFGKQARQWIDILASNGYCLWQILPMGPIGYGNSPYQPYSSYAGDEIYIALDELVNDGLLDAKYILPYGDLSNHVDYINVRKYKEFYIHQAWENCCNSYILRDEFEQFKKKNSQWLNDYALFMVFKKSNNGQCWVNWPNEHKYWPENRTVNLDDYELAMDYEMFEQFVFYRQWEQLKGYANSKGIQIMGDVPFYVGLDSCDVWANKASFLLDENCNPTFVAGVPPDYFSAVGQRWGNPIYNWNYLQDTDYKFWIDRLKHNDRLFDITRVDHFRAFDTYWKIPASCETAIDGEWVEAPGYQLFDTLYQKCPGIEIVAEDLGMMRDQVYELRDHYHLSGMRIFQFECNPDWVSADLHENENTIVYTGTHDNQTLKGWLNGLNEEQFENVCDFFAQYDGNNLNEQIIDCCYQSKAYLVITPLQDILALDDSARINVPGTIGSPNWEWKLENFVDVDAKLPKYCQMLTKHHRQMVGKDKGEI